MVSLLNFSHRFQFCISFFIKTLLSLQEIQPSATKLSVTTQISPLISTHLRRHLIVVAKFLKQHYICDDTNNRRYRSSQIRRRENFQHAGNCGNPFATRRYFLATIIASQQNFSISDDNSRRKQFIISDESFSRR